MRACSEKAEGFSKRERAILVIAILVLFGAIVVALVGGWVQLGQVASSPRKSMANEEHVEVVRRGAEAIEVWREENPDTQLDLAGADCNGADLAAANLRGADLTDANLSGADLSGANLFNARLLRADLEYADLTKAELAGANVAHANLFRANLSSAHLAHTDFTEANIARADLNDAELIGCVLHDANLVGANLVGANLTGARLGHANLARSKLTHANFAGARFWSVALGNVDLSEVDGLTEAIHRGPSSVGIDTIVLSQGKISDVFLKGCGVPDEIIDHIPSLIGSLSPIQFYSCFISYNQHDEAFAKRLNESLKAKGLRVWFAPEDLKIGDRFHDEIESAIRVMDKLLLVLSETSVKSDWVAREVERALTAEKKTGKTKLFPIRLCSQDVIDEWEAPSSKHVDLAEQVRLRHIGDFSNWKDHDSFEEAFERLLRDLAQDDAVSE